MAISIGDAVLKVGIDTKSMDKGLKGLQSKIAKHHKAIGIGMAAAGGAIIAMGLASVKAYANMGDEVHKMSLRTGFATETLSRLRYAAGLGGAGLADIEKAAKRMAVTILDAKDGLTETVRQLDRLGIAVEDFEGLTPEEQFMMLAEALSNVDDASERAAIAQKVFGRAGTALLPMLSQGTEGLKEIMEEAERFAVIFDQEAADAAATLTDQMGQLKGATDKVKVVIAEALMPTILDLTASIRDVVADVVAWTKEHPELTETIVKVAGVIGGLLLVLGPLLIFLPGITAALPLLGLAFHAALGPVGLITAAIVGLIAVGVLLWKNWDKVVHFMKVAWENIKIVFANGVKFLVSTVLKPFLFYIEHYVGTIVRVIGKAVGIFNKDWGEAIEKVADGMANLDTTITNWADNLITSSERTKTALKKQTEAFDENKESVDDLSKAIDPGLVTAQKAEQVALSKTTEIIASQKKALEGLTKTVGDYEALEQFGEYSGPALGGSPYDIVSGPGVTPSGYRRVYYDQHGRAIDMVRDTYVSYGPEGMQPLPEGAAKMYRDSGTRYLANVRLEPIGVAPRGFAEGGIAMRPMRANIAEKGPEVVLPLDRGTLEKLGIGGFKTANIYFQVDGRTMIRVLGQPLVDEIRIRTGARI